MQLTTIKCGRAIAKQLIDALEAGAEELERAQENKQGDPVIALEQQNLAIKQADLQRKAMVDKQNALESEQDFALREAELQGRMINEREKNKLKELEEARKQEELRLQAELKRAELAAKVNIDTNIAGDVRTLE